MLKSLYFQWTYCYIYIKNLDFENNTLSCFEPTVMFERTLKTCLQRVFYTHFIDDNNMKRREKFCSKILTRLEHIWIESLSWEYCIAIETFVHKTKNEKITLQKIWCCLISSFFRHPNTCSVKRVFGRLCR